MGDLLEIHSGLESIQDFIKHQFADHKIPQDAANELIRLIDELKDKTLS